MEHGSRFFNRELSALEYNARLLACAEDVRRPALDRARFLAIFSRNLDEFFQIRVSGLREQADAGVTGASPDGLSPRQQLDEIRARAQELVARQVRVFEHDVKPLLDAARRPDHRLGRSEEGAATRAPAGVRGADLSGPDPARCRSGAPVPVHQRPLAEPRGRGPRSGERRAPLRARQGPAAPAPLPQALRRPKVRAGGASDRREPRPAVRGHEDRRAAPVPSHARRGHRGRGRRSGRPPRRPGVAAAGPAAKPRGACGSKSPARCRSGCARCSFGSSAWLPPTCT